MDYPIKTLGQLRPILQGFRKAAGLTQAGMASHLGVTQQTYAQLEANPAAVSVDRLFRVLRVLQVDLTLVPRAAGSSESDVVVEETLPPAPITQPVRKTAATRATKKDLVEATGNAKRSTPSSPNQKASPAAPARSRSKSSTSSGTSRGATKPKSVNRKREEW
ncbi:helix-turn-helix domain-containing protein [Paraburkholderia metrosideri]|uniref:HTH cro/C1-type domain-containing protein n=1 Tax=Paraburkholderia metrosideri TaxID=580937 RepID=A0ABM8P7S6_9BURK|nr:helix-turn-helix transcriptional regulator [Paraburkholderia metrosideri]CAD6558587.1 hypothetical protein LMG28140_06420 [Paraburkholderia metrosideri]